MTGVIATIPRLRITDAPGGSVTVYAAGTTTLENTWQDRALTIFNTNPIILDATGSCVIWVDSAKTYKIVVKDAAGATLWTQDNIVGGGVDTSFELLAAAIQAAVDGAAASAASVASTWAGTVLAPEDFGAVGNANYYDSVTKSWYVDAAYVTPAHDDFAAFKLMYDEVNKRGGGYVKCAPNKNYWINKVVYNPAGAFTFAAVSRYDGRTCTAPFFYGAASDGSEAFGAAVGVGGEPLYLAGLNGFVFDGNGSKITCKGDFKLYAGQNRASWHDKMTMVPFRMQHCDNVVIQNITLDGEWRKQILELGPTVGQRHDYAIWGYACKNVYMENVKVTDFGMDAVVIGHRYGSQVGTGAFQSTPIQEVINATTYQTDGWSKNWKIVNCDFDHCGRQGSSPVGVQGFTVIGGSVSDIKMPQSTLPTWKTGDPAGNYKVPGVSPGLAYDFEPDRTYPEAVRDVLIIGNKMKGCVSGFVGASGNAYRNGGDLTVAPSAIDTATGIVTVTAHGLPDYSTGNHIRVRNSGGGLPSPLAAYTDYWVIYLDANTFKLAATKELAAAGTALALTTQGTGTHFFTVHRGLPSVRDITLVDCDMDHPAEGSGSPFTLDCETFRIKGGTLRIRPSTGVIEFNETQGRIDARLEGVNIQYTGRVYSHSSGNAYFMGIKTVALPGGVDTATDAINITAHGYGKYDNTPVWVKATTLPAPLEFGAEYYVIKVDDDNFKLAYTEEQAKAGTAIDLTTGGTGTLSVSPLNGSFIEINDCDHDPWERPRFFKPEHVDLSGNYIAMDGHDRATGDPVVLGTTGGLPAPLVAGTTYYVIRDFGDNTKFRLAASAADATNGVVIDLTTQGTGIHEVRNGPTTNAINIDGPGFRFSNNRVRIPYYNHARTLTSQGQVSFSRMGRGMLFNNYYQTDLRNESPARDFNVLHADMVNSTARLERRGQGFTFTQSGQVLTLVETDTRVYTGTVAWTPASVAANTSAVQTVTVAGLRTTDVLSVNPPGGTAGLGIVGVRVSASDTLEVRWGNFTAGSLTPPSGTYAFAATRQGA